MKHKYIIQKNGSDASLTIKEYAELDKGIFSFVCEENYDPSIFENVIEKGTKPVLELIRTNNFFPPSRFAEQIARSIVTLLSSQDQESIELYCDDTEFLNTKDKSEKESEEEDSETALDDFIEDDNNNVESDFDDSVNTRDGVVSIKVDTNPDNINDVDATT